VLLSIGAIGCTLASPPGGPFDASADMRPDLIVAEPLRVAPGDLVSLAFPQETLRGVHFVLERKAGDSWQYLFDLSAAEEGGEPSWYLPGAEGVGFPDIGITGPGPDIVAIPDVAEPGDYRICTGNAGENFCAELEIAQR
jgi:hypothetical protein